MSKEEIDKWLDNEYGVSYTRLEELHDFLIEQNMKYQDKIDILQQENKQLKEQLENKIDLYEDTISYQLGFDKGKEKYYQALLDIKEYIERNKGSWEVSTFSQREDVRKIVWTNEELDILDIVNKALGDKENE